ncbi:MAG: hypothetical protein RLZ28_427 [Actinomycetota bacterium]|jgi:hypothetical protein
MRFLIAVIDVDDNPGTGDEIAAIDEFNEGLVANGHFIIACGVTSPREATTIDNRASANLFTDGPVNETIEHMSGFWLINAADKTEALVLAAAGSKACNRKVEVRALHG